MCSCICNLFGNSERLLARFDGTRTCHYDDVLAANGYVTVGEANNRSVRLQITTDEFVGLADTNDLTNAWHFLQASGLNSALITSDAYRSPLRTGNGMRAQSQSLDFSTNVAHLLFSGMRLHHNQHSRSPENVTASVMNFEERPQFASAT